jgi:hypothetical protein
MTTGQPDDATDDLYTATRPLSWLFLLGLTFVAHGVEALYSSQGISPSARFQLLVQIGWWTLLWYWIREQCRPYKATFPMDFGLFVWWTAFLVVPYYLWKCERWKGLMKLTGLLAGLAVAHLTGGTLSSLVLDGTND